MHSKIDVEAMKSKTYTKTDVEAMIYNMSGMILSGQTDEEYFKIVSKLAVEHDLGKLLKKEFKEIGEALR